MARAETAMILKMPLLVTGSLLMAALKGPPDAESRF
jgi:hypothetical protein